MPKAEKGTPKALANAMKSKGLQRLRWYCQVCEKQCHTMSEGHLRQMLVVGENAGKYINNYSEDFKRDFLALLSRRWGTKRVLANMVYQEYIADKNHLHMNATQWVTLTDFVKQMGRDGILHVDETEKGWHISWIDTSPQALARQAANQAKERSDMDDEQRMRKLIAEQIEKANREKLGRSEVEQAEATNDTDKPPMKESILERGADEGPLKLAFSTSLVPKLAESSTSSAPTSISLSAGPSLSKPNPLKRAINPLKAKVSNPSSKAGTSSASSKSNHMTKKSALESIIAEDEARKKRRDERSWSGPQGHGASGLQIRRTPY